MVDSVPPSDSPEQKAPTDGDAQPELATEPTSSHTPTDNTVAWVVETVVKEIYETYNMMESNLCGHLTLGPLGCVIPSMMALSQLNDTMSIGQYAVVIAKGLVWFFWYGYMLDIENQVHGVEEDKLNKLPTKQKRPLVTGAWTMAGAQQRVWISRVVYTAVSGLIGGVPLTLCALVWIATCKFLYAVKPCNFITKNYISMTAASYCMLMGAWIMAGGPTSFATTWPFLCTAVWVGLSINVQDIRDEAGDRVIHRLTVPVLIGVENARKLWAVEVGVCSAIAYSVLRNQMSMGDTILGAGVVGMMVQSLLAKSTHDDNILYRNYIVFLYPAYGRAAFWVMRGMVSIG